VLRGGHCNGAPIDIRKRVYRRRHRVHSDGRPRVSILRGTRAIAWSEKRRRLLCTDGRCRDDATARRRAAI